jgi:hypothetical protein
MFILLNGLLVAKFAITEIPPNYSCDEKSDIY